MANPSAAQNLDLAELAAALAFPIVTGGRLGNPLEGTSGDVVIPDETAVTLITVTNGRSDDVLLRVDMIEGDGEGSDWNSTSFDCELTGRETTTFVFKSVAPGEAAVFVECSDNGDTDGQPIALFAGLQNGLLFVSVADPISGDTISEDIIFGDAVVIDTVLGQAYSFGAIPFQSGSGLNDGDKLYRFDGNEYARFPSVLAANFLAPVAGKVETELMLFTLDGTVGSLPLPRVKLGGFVFNDDEIPFDLTYEFDCFDIVALDEVNANFQFTGGLLGLGSVSGHLELVPQPIASSGPDAHDSEYGDGNGVRRRPAHGWLIQNVVGTVMPADEPMPGVPETVLDANQGPAAWGRPLAQSTTGVFPFLSDQPAVLDADVLN